MRTAGQQPKYPNGFTKEEIESCVHRGAQVGKLSSGCSKCAQPIYQCAVNGTCTLKQTKHQQKETVCVRCKSCLPASLVQLQAKTNEPEVNKSVDSGTVPVSENPVQVPEVGENGESANPTG